MSDYFVQDDFIKYLQGGDAYDESLNDDIFDGFEPIFVGNHFLEEPGEHPYQPDPAETEEPRNQEQEGHLPNTKDDSETDSTGFLKSKDTLPKKKEGAPADNSFDGTSAHRSESNPETQSHPEPTVSLKNQSTPYALGDIGVGQSINVDQAPHYQPTKKKLLYHGLSHSVGQQVEVTSIPQHDSPSQSGQQTNFLDENDGRPLEPDILAQVREENRSTVYNIEAANSFSNSDQPQIHWSGNDYPTQFDPNEWVVYDPLANMEPGGDLLSDQLLPTEFEFDVFNSQEWKNYLDQNENRDLAQTLGIDIPESYQTSGTSGKGKGKQETGHISAGEHGRSTSSKTSRSENVDSSSNFVQPYIYSQQRSAVVSSGENQEEMDGEHLGESNLEGSHAQGESNEIEIDVWDENDPLVDEDSQQKGWGRTGTRNGQEVWFNPEFSEWQLSASHHDMRATLIARAQAEYPNDRYLHPDETGGLPHGETAFFKPHQYRGPSREQCADELFAWRDYLPKRDEDGKLIRKGGPKNTKRHPGYMYEGKKILLDPHNNPVVNHKFIPLTLSIYTDGAKLQEMTLHPECRQVDLWARMPRWERKANRNGGYDIVPLRDRNTRVNMPMSRFRERKGTIAGCDREGTEQIMAGLLSFYRSHGFDPVAAGNSVKAFPRDLEPWEIKEVRLGNAARFGAKAGSRALDDEKRQNNHRRMLKTIEEGKKKQAAKSETGARKRQREDEDEAEDSQSPAFAPQKRRRGGQEIDLASATWDERQYADHQRSSYFQGGQIGYGLPSNPQPYGNFQASPYIRSAPNVPHQHQNPREYQMPMPNQLNFYQNSANIGTSFAPVQNNFYQSPFGNVQMQAARNPYERRATDFSSNSYIVNNDLHPNNRHPQSNAGVAEYRNLGGNTLGPGGCRGQQAPKQTLGKRQRDATVEHEDFEELIPWTPQDEANLQAEQFAEVNPPHKRQRHNEPSGMEPRPQRRHQNGRISRPQYYGAVDTPQPFAPPNDVLENTRPASGIDVDAGVRRPLKTPEGLPREMGEVFAGANPNEGFTGILNQGMNTAPSRPSAFPRRNVGMPSSQRNVEKISSDMNQAPRYDGASVTPAQRPNRNTDSIHVNEATPSDS